MVTASDSEPQNRHRPIEGDIFISGGVEALEEGLQTIGAFAEAIQVTADRGYTSMAVSRLESIRLLRITWGCTAQVSTNFGADTVAVSAPLALPDPAGAKTLWTGTTVSPGHIGAVPPGRDSESLTPVGAQALVGLVDASAVAETADVLGWRAQLPNDAGPLPSHLGLRKALVALHHATGVTGYRYPHRGDTGRDVNRLLEGLAYAWRPHTVDRPQPRRRFAVSARIVSAAIEFAEAGFGSAPSMAELCAATGVSERRVRDAFIDVKGVPPQTYFQVRSLNLARERLRAVSPSEATVTDVAFSLGNLHLGRFARRYRALFAETPRETLYRRH
jgi:AraC-like DNA-binding protein